MDEIDWRNFPKALLFLVLLVISIIWFLLVRRRTNSISLQKRLFFFIGVLSIVRVLDSGVFRQICFADRNFEVYCVWLNKVLSCFDILTVPITLTIYFILMNFWGEQYYLLYCVTNNSHGEFVKIRKFMNWIFILSMVLGFVIVGLFSVLIFAIPLRIDSITYRIARFMFRTLANLFVTVGILFFGIKTMQMSFAGPLRRIFFLTALMVILNGLFFPYSVMQIIAIWVPMSSFMWILSICFACLEFTILLIVLVFLTPWDFCRKKEYIQSQFTTSLDQEEYFKDDEFDDDKSEIA